MSTTPRPQNFLTNNGSAEKSVVPSVTDMDLQERDISIRDIIEILLKGKWVILSTFLVVLTAVAIYTFLIPSEYEAVALVKVDSNKSGSGSEMGQLMGFSSPNRDINNELELLRSRTLSKRVASQLLENRSKQSGQIPALKPDENGRISERTVAARLRTGIKVKQLNPDVDILELRYTSTSPQEAQFIANSYVDEYQNWRLSATRESVTMARQFLEQQYGDLDQTLKNTEANLESFLESKNVVKLDEEASQLVQQANSIKLERDKSGVDLEVAKAQLQGLQRQIESNSPGLLGRVSSTSEQEIGRLKNQIADLQIQREVKVSELSRDADWKGKEASFPEIQNIDRQLTSLRHRLDQLANNWLEESGTSMVGASSSSDPTGVKENLSFLNQLRRQMLEKEIEISGLRARQNVLGSRLNEYEGKLSTMPGTSIQLAQLQRDREGKEKLFQYITERLQEARSAESATVGGIQIIDPAEMPGTPVRPNRFMNILLGVLLGLALGIGIVFVRNALDDIVRKPEDLRKRGYSVLGIVPSMERIIRSDFKGRDKILFENRAISTSLLSLLNPLSPISEAFRRLRTNVEYSRLDQSVQTLMVTSPAPGDGKTVTALNLAIAMAQSGRRTLYVDADLRRPAGHKMIEMPKEPGLVEILFEVQNFRADDYYTGIEDLYMIPAGSSVPNPAELLASKKMRNFVLQLRNEFDVIIFDTPPVLAVSDAVLMVNQVDAAILVVSSGETNWQGLQRSVESLTSIGSRLAGIVLNRFDPKTAYGYYSAYNSYEGYYYNYYEYGETNSSKIKKVAKQPKKPQTQA